MPYIQLPDNTYAEIPEGMDYDTALAKAKQAAPEAFGIKVPHGSLPAAKNDASRSPSVQAQTAAITEFPETVVGVHGLSHVAMSMAGGILVGIFLFYLLKPKGKPQTAAKLGRYWLAYSVLFLGSLQLGNYFNVPAEKKLHQIFFSAVVLFPLVYLCGYLYGKYFKFRRNIALNGQIAGEYAMTKHDVDQSTKLASAERTSPIVAKPIMNNTPPVNALPAIAIESSQQSMPEIEDRLYEQIAQEIETNAVDKGVWTKAFALSGGDDKLTRVAYIKARFEKLMAAENAKLIAMQQEREREREREVIARHEQEQEQRDRERERDEIERFKKLCVRIKVAESTGLDEAKKLAAKRVRSFAAAASRRRASWLRKRPLRHQALAVRRLLVQR